MNELITTKPLEMKTRRRLFPEGVLGEIKNENERKEILEDVKKELENKKNYKPEFTLFQQMEFIEACKNDNLEKAKELIDKGIDPNTREISNKPFSMEKTVLMNAIIERNLKIISLLLKQPTIDVNLQDSFNNTAVMYAAKSNSIECFSLLVADPRVDFNILAFRKTTLLMELVNMNLPNYISLIKDKVDLDLQNVNGDTALMLAIKLKHINVAKLLINAGSNVNIKADGNSAFSLTLKYSLEKDLMSDLINAGVNIPFNFLHKIGYKNHIKYLDRLQKSYQISKKKN